MNKSLTPVSDEELEEIIEEVGNAIVAEIEKDTENAELSPDSRHRGYCRKNKVTRKVFRANSNGISNIKT